jgi:hypothetical protein
LLIHLKKNRFKGFATIGKADVMAEVAGTEKAGE